MLSVLISVSAGPPSVYRKYASQHREGRKEARPPPAPGPGPGQEAQVSPAASRRHGSLSAGPEAETGRSSHKARSLVIHYYS